MMLRFSVCGGEDEEHDTHTPTRQAIFNLLVQPQRDGAALLTANKRSPRDLELYSDADVVGWGGEYSAGAGSARMCVLARGESWRKLDL